MLFVPFGGASIEVYVLYVQILICCQKIIPFSAVHLVARLFLDQRKLRFNFQVFHGSNTCLMKYTCADVMKILLVATLLILWFLTDQNEVSVLSLDEMAELTDKDISSFVSDVS